jgi:hypothetical protein
MAGGSGSNDAGGCWIHVSDRTSLYVLSSLETWKSGAAWADMSPQNCLEVAPGSTIQGAVTKKGRYIRLAFPSKKEGKPNWKVFQVVQVGDDASLQ